MGAYMRAEGYVDAESSNFGLRMLAPVNMRSTTTIRNESEFGNKFLLAVIHIPVGSKDPLEILQRSKQELDRLKRSPEMPIMVFTTLTLPNMLQVPIGNRVKLLNHVMEKFSFLFTNVPGPTTMCTLAGSEINDIMFHLTGVFAKLPVVSLITYRENLRIGISINPAQVKDAPKFMNLFASELERLRSEARTSRPERIAKKVHTTESYLKLMVFGSSLVGLALAMRWAKSETRNIL
eukprot:gnl/MRDRNA2_/MRDRNA2_186322_c0_seq1.p1 gnl/MRDRNA2_/MRDRNA2_186322_c0~~gnl/MRDRNA2_/MRDRNA2_186322_c0_seq1.p1  ORF type:complete len:274 (+),score=40.83 gnl/MRDRNA2_/MRDRNA2_186322_c0_seq1:116-823(+)